MRKLDGYKRYIIPIIITIILAFINEKAAIIMGLFTFVWISTNLTEFYRAGKCRLCKKFKYEVVENLMKSRLGILYRIEFETEEQITEYEESNNIGICNNCLRNNIEN